jgi:glycosyltransferase
MNQSYPDIEHIIIDGKSDDGTLGIIGKYKSHISQYISETDRGMYDAINKGMQICTGDIIGILNSDDILYDKDVVATIVQEMQQHQVDSVYGDLVYVNPKDINQIYRIWKGKPYKRNLFKLGWMPAHPTFYIRRSVYEKYGGYESHFFSAADYELMARYLFLHQVTSHYIPKMMVKMRTGGQSNNGLKKRIRANRRDYLAMRKNNIPFAFFVSILKPLSKLHQYYKK